MATNTLTTHVDGDTIFASHVNELIQALRQDFVGRGAANSAEAGQNLGTQAFPWGTAYMTNLVLSGQSLDLSQVTRPSNRIVSGASRADSSQPMFLDANGAAATVTIQGNTTNLVIDINGATVTVVTDIDKTNLTVAPSANNTALINDPALNDQDFTKMLTELTLDAMGANVTPYVGEWVTFKAASEYMFGFLESTTRITNIKRGFFFDTAQAPIQSEVLSDNDTLTFMSTAWLFIENNATTVDATYSTPVMSTAAPATPVAGDYWFDITNQTWKRYSGIEFVVINRTLIGLAIVDATNCIAVRPFDFDKVFKDELYITLEKESASIIRTKDFSQRVHIYGTELIIDQTRIDWNTASNFESGVSESASTQYYLYLTEDGESKISNIAPYDRPDLRGAYHPYQTWRYIGSVYNDSSSDFENPLALNDGTISGMITVGSPGDSRQQNQFHHMELGEPGFPNDATTLAMYLFKDSGSLTTDEKGTYTLTNNNAATAANGVLNDGYATGLVNASTQSYTNGTLLDTVPAAICIHVIFKADNGQTEQFLISKSTVSGSDRIYMNITSAGQLRTFIEENNTGGQSLLSSTILPNSATEWTHLCVAWDTTYGLRLFVNGILEARDSTQTTLMQNGTFSDFGIGVSDSGSLHFDGKIALVAVQNVVVTQNLVNQVNAVKYELPRYLYGKEFDLTAKLQKDGSADFEQQLKFDKVSKSDFSIYRKGGENVFGAEIASGDNLQVKARL